MYGKASLVMACVAMVLLTVGVAITMLRARVLEMKAHKIHPQSIATSAQSASQLLNTQAADNYRNLFEMPVLFYLLCVLLMQLEMVNTYFVTTAWIYVLLRYLHSYIHCTYNKVLHRFQAFVSSTTILFLMWVGLVIQLLLT